MIWAEPEYGQPSASIADHMILPSPAWIVQPARSVSNPGFLRRF
jgi:hypothetical protein